MSEYSSKERPTPPRPRDPKPDRHKDRQKGPNPDVYGKPMPVRPTRPIDPKK